MTSAQKPAENSDTATAPAPGNELPKAYVPREHEGRVWTGWIGAGAFHADPARVLRGEAEPYCVLIPPPNVTAALHLGHALNNALQDILVRAHRMMGYETMWMPGTDHAGIATQAVVEKRVWQEEKKRRADFTREAFIAKIQAFKDEYEATITGQLKAMGCSCDWDRQRFTMDEQCARAVREAFFLLFRDGLIYRGKRLVNWDPALQTAVSDDECYDEEVDSFFYYLRYPVVHPHGATTSGERRRGKLPPADAVPVTWSELASRGFPGAEAQPGEEQAWVTVATTRPETYLADTGVAVNPHDPRAKALRGLCVELPLVGRVIPIIEDSYVVLPKAMARSDEEAADPKAEFATGFLKVTPGHDPNDYDLYQRHKEVMDTFAGGPGAALINMMSPDGRVSDQHGWTDVGDAHLLVGKAMAEARKLVVKEFEARTVDGGGEVLLEGTRPYRHSLKFSDRSKAVIEPYLSDQWYVSVTDPRMAPAANRALVEEQRSGRDVQRGGTGVPPVTGDRGSTGVPPVTGDRGGTGIPPVPGDRGGTGVPPVPGDPYARLGPVTAHLNISQRNLPHFQEGGRTYFVTFRLARGELSAAERTMVLNACRHWHGERMELRAAVVMPDHVHLMLSPFEKEPGRWHSLAELLHSIKSFTSHELNKSRGTTGAVWQDESFDRIIRGRHEFAEKLVYMQRNPVEAGLAATWKDYPFTWISDEAFDGRLEFADRVLGAPSHRRDACATPPEATDQPGGDSTMRFFPARYAKTYETWHDNIRDWCISRQLWWGHRIPVWRGLLASSMLNQPGLVADEASVERAAGLSPEALRLGVDIAALLHQFAREGEVSVRRIDGTAIEMSEEELPESSLRDLATQEMFICLRRDNPELEKLLEATGFERDPDVLDTWFSSALWPMSTMGWPESTDLLKAFNPSTSLSTAREIITLWVSRMVMFNRYFMPEGWSEPGHRRDASATPSYALADMGRGTGPAPFRDVFIHAVIQDGEGRKMSKMLGNGVDPLDIIATHGADAMRFTLCQMATNTQDVRMPVVRDPATGRNTSPKFDLGRNFCNKLWNAVRFAIGILSADSPGAPNDTPLSARSTDIPSRWMLSRLARAAGEVNRSLSNYEFADYAQTMYTLLWNDFCDWYLEAIKPTVAGNPGQRAVLRATLDAILRLLHPITPFVTESLHEKLSTLPVTPIDGLELSPSRRAGLLCTAGWPVASESLIDERAEAHFVRLQALVTAVREVRAQHNVKPSRRITLHAEGGIAGFVKDSGGLVETLALLARVAPPGARGPAAVAFRFEGIELYLSDLADAVDVAVEQARLMKLLAELDKSIATFEARLANPGYAHKAPPAMVEQTRQQLAKAKQDREAIVRALETLK